MVASKGSQDKSNSNQAKEQSFVKCPIELLSSTLSSNSIRLYLALLSYCYGQRNECWPSVATLAHQVGVTERSVQRLLTELELASWISVRPQAGLSNVYVIHKSPGRGDNRVVDTTNMGDSRVGGGVTLVSPESDLIESDLERESISDSQNLLSGNPQDESTAENISQNPTRGRGYVTLLEIGMSDTQAERWQDYPNLDEWVDYASSHSNKPAHYLLTCFSNGSELPTKKVQAREPVRQRSQSAHKIVYCDKCLRQVTHTFHIAGRDVCSNCKQEMKQ